MTFQHGNTHGVGKPGGYQDFVVRAKYLLDKHTRGGLKALMENEKEYDKLSVYDAMIVARIAEAITSDGNASMNSLLDRIIGKPVQPIAQKTEVSISADTLAAMQEMKQLPMQALEAVKQIIDDSVIYTVDNETVSE